MTLYLGMDIGGTKIAGGVVTDNGYVVKHARRATPLTGRAAMLDTVFALASELITGPVAAVGIGTGGQVNSELGIIVSATELLPGWAGTAVKEAVETRLGLPCFVDNDVNALAVGEGRFGMGKGLATVVSLALGTGVGGALLLDGQVHHGAHWSGGEFGHLLLTNDEGAPRKTLEEFASGPGLVQTYRELTGETGVVTGMALAEDAARDADGPAALAIARTGNALGFGLASLANALDPDLIVIGGGLASLGEVLLIPARRILSRYALPGPSQCPVVLAALGSHASLIGAAALAMPPIVL